MKIIIVSDAVWHLTGYGVTTKALCLALMKDGHQVANFAPGAFHMGNVRTEDGILVLGSNGADDRWGNKTLQHHVRTLQPDLIITWLDPQGLNEYGLDGVPLYIWAPVDTWPVPEQEMSIYGRAAKVLVCSEWGQRVLADQGLDAEYVPCGIDLDAYRIDPDGRQAWREAWGFRPDQFVVGMVGINGGSPDRKGYGYALEVIKKFHAQHPDAGFYLHTNPDSDGSSIDLRILTRTLGLEGVVKFPEYPGPAGWPVKYMREMYNGFDVLLHTSLTEGFGLPVVEAQACGTPVVYNAATSVTELVNPLSGDGALPLGAMWVTTGTQIAIPDVERMYEALERAAYENWDRPTVRGQVMRFDFQHTYDTYWKPLIASAPGPLVMPEGARKLRLGAGSDNDPSFTNHDRELFFPHIDVAHDLEVFPWPFADSSYDYIEMSDVIEHLNASVTDVMNELHRIAAPGAHVFIHTAKAGSWQHTQDPTHVKGFELNSFDYYDPSTDWGHQYRYSEREWTILRKTIEPRGGIVVILTPTKPTEISTAEGIRVGVSA